MKGSDWLRLCLPSVSTMHMERRTLPANDIQAQPRPWDVAKQNKRLGVEKCPAFVAERLHGMFVMRRVFCRPPTRTLGYQRSTRPNTAVRASRVLSPPPSTDSLPYALVSVPGGFGMPERTSGDDGRQRRRRCHGHGHCRCRCRDRCGGRHPCDPPVRDPTAPTRGTPWTAHRTGATPRHPRSGHRASKSAVQRHAFGTTARRVGIATARGCARP